MDFTTYQQTFLDILESPNPAAPYNDPDYFNYTKLNWARMHRWLKSGILNDDLVKAIESIKQPQLWIIITSPWCGDAAHTTPFMQRVSEFNPLIKVDYQLRDSEPFLIEHYLTNGVSKSIPKLVIRDADGNDLAVWGSRPAGCQLLFEQLVTEHVEMAQKKIALQQWYNEDKGVSFQLELLEIITKINNA